MPSASGAHWAFLPFQVEGGQLSSMIRFPLGMRATCQIQEGTQLLEGSFEVILHVYIHTQHGNVKPLPALGQTL